MSWVIIKVSTRHLFYIPRNAFVVIPCDFSAKTGKQLSACTIRCGYSTNKARQQTRDAALCEGGALVVGRAPSFAVLLAFLVPRVAHAHHRDARHELEELRQRHLRGIVVFVDSRERGAVMPVQDKSRLVTYPQVRTPVRRATRTGVPIIGNSAMKLP